METLKYLILLLAVICVCCVAWFVRFFVINKYKKSVKLIPKNFTVTAHSGSCKTVQNSLESVRVGAENADVIEFDLNFNGKGEPVLSHDAPKGGEPALEEAFEFLAEHKQTKANVDLKSTANLSKIQELAEKYGVLEQIFFTGVSEDWTKAVKEQCPKIPYYLNYSVEKRKNRNEEYIRSVIRKIKDTGAIGLNFNFMGAGKELTEAIQKEGFLVSVWTVDGNASMYKMLSFGVDNITTKKPVRLKNALEL